MFLQFGGYDNDNGHCMDTFYISSIRNFEWKLQPKYKLKTGTCYGGYILNKDYIIMLGGETSSGVYTDKIYVLDLKRSNGWEELKDVKCPVKSNYMAVLDVDINIHLYTQINEWPKWEESVVKNYSICVEDILPDVGMLVNGFMRDYIISEEIGDKEKYAILIINNGIIEQFVGITYI